MKDERCCGDCCWFKWADNTGLGTCSKHYFDVDRSFTMCDNIPCDNYVSIKESRHHLAVLLCHNRWRRGNGEKMQDPKELGKALDFAIDYIKTFMEL